MDAIKTQTAASLNMTTLVFALVAEKSWVAALDCVAGFAAKAFAAVAAPFGLDSFDPVEALRGNFPEATDAEKAVAAEATVGLDFVVDQMTAERAEAAAKAADWAGRTYKENDKKVTVGDPDRVGDYPWVRPTATFKIGDLNANRRRLKVEGYTADVVELDGFLAIAADMKVAIDRARLDVAASETFFAAARKVHDTRSGW